MCAYNTMSTTNEEGQKQMVSEKYNHRSARQTLYDVEHHTCLKVTSINFILRCSSTLQYKP